MAYPGRLLTTLIIVAGISPAQALAQSPRAMTLVDLLNVPRLSDLQLSPDGRQVLYVLAEADWESNDRIAHIWRVDADGTGAIQMTAGTEGESGPRWSPDGRTIAFLARRGDADANQIHLVPNDGGEARALMEHPTAVSSISWSPDGDAIYFLAPDERDAPEQERLDASDDVYAFDEDYRQRHLWKVAVADGAETRITGGDYSVLRYTLSRDGRKLAHHRAPNPLFGYSDRGEVWVMSADGTDARQLTENTVPESGVALSPDNSSVLFRAGANEQFDTYYNGKVFIVPAAGGPARLLTSDFVYDVQSAQWSEDGQAVYAAVNMGVHAELFEIDVTTGATRQLTDGEHAVRGWSFVPSANRHVFQLNEPERAGDVWTLATTSNPSPARVTDVFGHLAMDFTLPRQERIEWRGADGVTVEGLLFYPLGYEPGRQYPLCVQTHGGPAASDKFGFQSWSNYVPVLTAMGYAVLKPNYRGSTGYGDPFLRDMVGSYFKNAHLDVMAGVDYLIERGIADPDRMVKMGWSGGGHMTNKIVTFTDRFKAAASGAGAANWISMYAQSDVRTYRTPWFGGTPWQKDAPIDVYWNHSPLKDVANVTTPTIFLVGEEDPRVPMPKSVEMYRALKSNGVPTHLYVAPREPHGWRELRHELFKMNVELEWFERHATGRPYEWERAPGDAAPKKERDTSAP